MSWLLLLFRCQLNDWRFSQSLNTKITFSPYKHIYSSVFTTTQRQTVLFAKVHALTQNIHKELLIDSHFYYVNIHVVSRKLKFNLFFDFFFLSLGFFAYIHTHLHTTDLDEWSLLFRWFVMIFFWRVCVSWFFFVFYAAVGIFLIACMKYVNWSEWSFFLVKKPE